MVAPFLALAAAIALWSPASPTLAKPKAVSRPVVVELFTSQGCHACGKANALAGRMAGRTGVLPLTFSVDYWDYLGWTDTLAKPEFTARQRNYMRRLSQRDVYTPQVVVDGRGQAAGARADRIEALIQDAAKDKPSSPNMSFIGGGFIRVETGRPPKGGAEVWLVRYEPKPEPVEVSEGENQGETVTYVNAVRELNRLGAWTGRRRTFALPTSDNKALRTLVILQGAKGGRILSVLPK